MFLLKEKSNYYTNTGNLADLSNHLTAVLDLQVGKILPDFIDFNFEFSFTSGGTSVIARFLSHFNSTWTDNADNNNILPCWNGAGDSVLFTTTPTVLGAAAQGTRIVHVANFADDSSVPSIATAMPRYVLIKLTVAGLYTAGGNFGTKIHYRSYSRLGSDYVL